MSKMVKKAIKSTGTFTVPAGIYSLIVQGCGAGGSGGGGSSGFSPGPSTTTIYYSSGGGGGGSAQSSMQILQVVPGEVLNITIGTSGSPGTGGAIATADSNAINAGTNGGDGSDTIIFSNFLHQTIAQFKGAKGGKGGQPSTGSVNNNGGLPINNISTSNLPTGFIMPGSGGTGTIYSSSSFHVGDGIYSFSGLPAGVGGAIGTSSNPGGNGTNAGGGGGGSGGGPV